MKWGFVSIRGPEIRGNNFSTLLFDFIKFELFLILIIDNI